MLLKFFRRKARTILIATIVGIVPPFLFLYGWYSRSRGESLYVLAKINGEPIWVEEFYEEIRTLEEMYPFIKDPAKIRKMAYDNLVEKSILLQEAKKLRIKATPEEMVEFFKTLPYFIDSEGKFHKEYLERMPDEELRMLEKIAQENIIIGKLKNMIVSSVKVGEEEVVEEYKRRNSLFHLLLIGKDISKVKLEEQPSDEELKQFMEENKERFRKGPFYKLEWIKVPLQRFLPLAEVKEEEIKEYYSSHKEEFRKSDTEFIPLAEVKEKIRKRLQTRKAWKLANDEAFDLSVKLLDEKDWKKIVGDKYPLFRTKDWILEKEIYSRLRISPSIVERSPLNEASEPVKIGEGYLIFKVVEKKPRYLPVWEEIKSEVLKAWKEEKKIEKAKELMKEVKERMGKGEPLKNLVEQYQLTEEKKEKIRIPTYIPGWGFIEEVSELKEGIIE
ncbi:MAG TPA: hypothetical protein ENG13_00905, partial [bacterium]|nr:hypothetical protein [bacterium]HEX67608.1 hypothetical protein [bacterium]